MELEQLDPAEVVVVLAGSHTAAAIRGAVVHVAAGVAAVSPDLRMLVVHDEAAAAELSIEAPSQPALSYFPSAFQAPDRFPAITPGTTDAYRILFAIAHRVGARAAVVLGSAPEMLTTDVITALVQPVIAQSYDVVAPRYSRAKFDGLINSAIVYPLTRALYGKRIEGQIGVDYAFSARVAARWQSGAASGLRGRAAWILPQAVAEDFAICEARLGIVLPPASEPAELSTTLSQVLGSLFLDIDRHAPFWQRISRSQPVPAFGPAAADRTAGGPIEVRPLIESFQLAYRNLQDVWGLVLPPATLIELKRLTLQPMQDFRLPDDLWARIVFDFALGHRIRAINRDHLLRALTPAYLAWVASYALEIGEASAPAVHDRLERLCLAYEAEKPYLLRRWRWPDRFNP